MNVIYSAEALDDLKRLREFIALHNPSAAIRIASELVSKIEHLSTFPELGTEVKQAPSPKVIRNIVFGNYIVRYAVLTDAIAILRIWHHYQQR